MRTVLLAGVVLGEGPCAAGGDCAGAGAMVIGMEFGDGAGGGAVVGGVVPG